MQYQILMIILIMDIYMYDIRTIQSDDSWDLWLNEGSMHWEWHQEVDEYRELWRCRDCWCNQDWSDEIWRYITMIVYLRLASCWGSRTLGYPFPLLYDYSLVVLNWLLVTSLNLKCELLRSFINLASRFAGFPSTGIK